MNQSEPAAVRSENVNRATLRATQSSCRRVGVLLCLLAGAALAGCATPSPPADDLDTLSVEAARQGKTTPGTVRWGGTIVEVANSDAGTRLQVLSRPLRRSGRPVRDDRSDGRFIAHVATFLDPEIYKPGRDITVVGSVKPSVKGKVGEASYTFAAIDVENYQYWKPEPPIVKLPPGYYPNRHFIYSNDWPFDYYKYRRYRDDALRKRRDE